MYERIKALINGRIEIRGWICNKDKKGKWEFFRIIGISRR